MTVRDLIRFLSNQPEHAEVLVFNEATSTDNYITDTEDAQKYDSSAEIPIEGMAGETVVWIIA